MTRHVKRLLRKSKQPTVHIAKRATSFYALLFAALFAGVGTYVIMSSFAASGPTANLWIVSSGGSSSCTRQGTPLDLSSSPASAMCSSMQAADNAAASTGDTVRFKAGTYGNQSLVATSKTVSFIGTGADTVLGSLTLGGTSGGVQPNKVDNKTIDSFAAGGGTFIGANNTTIKNGSLTGGSYVESSSYLTFDKIDFNGNHETDDTVDVYEQDRSYQPNNHITFTRSQIRGARASVASSHPDGIQFCNCSTAAGRGDSYHATEITISYSKFYDNECINVRTNPGTGLDMIGNVFNASVNGLSGCNSYIADVIGAGGTMAYNTFLDGQPIQNNQSWNNPMQYWTGNVGAGVGYSGCQVMNATWSHNVWTEQKCNNSDKLATDLKLNTDGSPQAGSPVIDAGDGSSGTYGTIPPITTGSYPSVDYNGNNRFAGTAPDAGAFESGATGGGGSGGSTANVFVAPNGSDTGSNCKLFSTATTNPDPSGATLCASFSKAYQLAGAGNKVEVEAGNGNAFPDQTLSNLTPKTPNTYIVFAPATGVTINTGYLSVSNTDNVEFDDMTVDRWGVTGGSSHVKFKDIKVLNVADASTGNAGFIDGASDFQIIGGEIGQIDPGDGIQIWPDAANTNIVIDGLYMHDLTRNTDPENHDDCMQVANVDGLTIKNSTFVNCGTQGLFFNPFNSGVVKNITVENNFMGPAQLGSVSMNVGTMTNLTFRFNTVTQSITVDPSSSGVTFVGNVLAGFNFANSGYNCGIMADNTDTFDYNIINSADCNGANKPTHTTYKTTLTSDLVSTSTSPSSAFDPHLKSTAIAVNYVPTSVGCPSTDIDGDARPQSTACDAGADEYSGNVSVSAPVNSAVPIISGTKTVGNVLSTTNGTWSNSPTSYSYQWQRCISGTCTNISGATASTYTLVSADATNTVKVKVTATNTGGNATATSAATTAISAASSTKIGDFNSDNVVNIYDMGIILSKWLSTTATAQDLNSDGIVNIYDLGIFLSHYGT